MYLQALGKLVHVNYKEHQSFKHVSFSSCVTEKNAIFGQEIIVDEKKIYYKNLKQRKSLLDARQLSTS